LKGKKEILCERSGKRSRSKRGWVVEKSAKEPEKAVPGDPSERRGQKKKIQSVVGRWKRKKQERTRASRG